MGRVSSVDWLWTWCWISNGIISVPIYRKAYHSNSSQPLIAIQYAASPNELSSATAFIVWCQYIGPTIFLALYNAIFVTSLGPELLKQAPNADAQAIIAAGATNFRKITSKQDLPGVLLAYSNSLDKVFYLVAAAGVVAWCAAWGMGWEDIRKTKKESSGMTEEQEINLGNEK